MSLTNKIFLSLTLGLVLGSAANLLDLGSNIYLIDFIDVPGELFISSLKMLVVPVVFFSIVCGVSNLSELASLGRIGGKSVFLYLLTTSIAISLALLISSIINPGQNANLGIATETFIQKQGPSLKDVIISIVPSNPIKAFAESNMLQIIFFAVLMGTTISLLKEKTEKIKITFNLFNDLFLKMIEIVMYFAPIGVFFLIFKTFVTQGFQAIADLASYFFTVLMALIFHFFISYGGLLLIFTKINIFKFYLKIKDLFLFAFSTASSAATIPITLKTVEEKLGVEKSVGSFTVPLGATINMDGTAIMQGVATVFIANAYNIDLVLVDYLSVILVATLASIGTAGVPGVGLIMLTMVLNQVGLPAEGIALIIGIDRILDMTRTAVNVTGDAAISCLVAKSENKINNKTINS
ncbi:MAG: dicarboxylate/amino acid:cation symporter [Rickettsiales bacterium]|nr:dicarboxylate/amino acid:cation symporter [Rickettsiales bacterium]